MQAKKLQTALSWLRSVPSKEKLSTLRIQGSRGRWTFSVEGIVQADYFIQEETPEEFNLCVDRKLFSAFINSLKSSEEVVLSSKPIQLTAGKRKLKLGEMPDALSRKALVYSGNAVDISPLLPFKKLIQSYSASPEVPHLHLVQNSSKKAYVTNRLSALMIPGLSVDIAIPVSVFDTFSKTSALLHSPIGLTVTEAQEDSSGLMVFPWLDSYNEFPIGLLSKSFSVKPSKVCRFRAKRLLRELLSYISLKPDDPSITLSGKAGQQKLALKAGDGPVEFESEVTLLQPVKKDFQEKVLSTALTEFLKFSPDSPVELSFTSESPYYWSFPNEEVCLLTARKK